MDKWDKCGFPVDERDLEGRVCYGGLDLSSTTDITAFVLVFSPEDDAGKYKGASILLGSGGYFGFKSPKRSRSLRHMATARVPDDYGGKCGTLRIHREIY